MDQAPPAARSRRAAGAGEQVHHAARAAGPAKGDHGAPPRQRGADDHAARRQGRQSRRARRLPRERLLGDARAVEGGRRELDARASGREDARVRGRDRTIMKQYDWSSLTEAERRAVLARPALADDAALKARVAEIVAEVRRGGDDAIRRLTRTIDGIEIDAIEVAEDEIAAAERALSPAQRDAIRAAAANIEAFHRAQLPANLDVETAPGVRCERISRPIRRVGLYVPAGTAPLPSTALMLGIPARLAGCRTRILCSPPQRDGRVDAAVLFAARVAGVERVFRIGGAQAVAAMAYGTETVPKVDKIFGP